MSSYHDITLTLNTEHGQVIAHEEAFSADLDPMLKAGGVTLTDFHGIPAEECAPVVESLLARLVSDPDRYRALEPEEGAYRETCRRLRLLLAAMRAEPDALVEVS